MGFIKPKKGIGVFLLAAAAAVILFPGWFLPLQAQPFQLPGPGFAVNFDADANHTPVKERMRLSETSPVFIEYDTATLALDWPDHRSQIRTFWIENTGSENITNLYYGIKNNDDDTWIFGPAAELKRLDRGEKLPVTYLFDWSRFFPNDPCQDCFYKYVGQEIPKTFSITVFQCSDIGPAPDYICGDPSPPPTVTVGQNHLIRVKGLEQLPVNATLAGQVSDQGTGQPVADAVITFHNPSGEIRMNPFNVGHVYSDQNGHYSQQLPAMTALVEAKATGYRTYYNVVQVPSGGTVSLDIPLIRKEWMASYTLKNTIDAQTGFWGWAFTPDRQKVLLTPGLSGTPSEITKVQAYAWMVNLDGTVAWKYFLGNESWGPAISSDGRMAAIPLVQAVPDTTATLRIVNVQDGTDMRAPIQLTPFQGQPNFPVAAFSPDSSRLAVGGGGDLWLLDTTDDFSEVWHKQLHRQVRALRFSPDGQTLYASCDPSPFFAFALDGSERWRTYMNSFAYQDNIALTADGSRIAVEAKMGGFAVLDQDDGHDVMRKGFRDGGGHSSLAAPDGSWYVSATGSQNGTHILDANGLLLWWAQGENEGMMITEDGGFILMGASLYDLQGDLLWKDDTAENDIPSVSVISPDKGRIVIASERGRIYFFEGLTERVTYQFLQVTKTGTGRGSIRSAPSGIDCGSDCSEMYASGSAVTLTATAEPGSGFGGWSGGGCSGTGACIPTIDGDITVTATFLQDMPVISVTPPSLDFGYKSINDTSVKGLVISNTGRAELLLGTINVMPGSNASEFSLRQQNCSNQRLPPSGVCNIEVAFTPKSAGVKGAILSIPSSDPDRSEIRIQLSGTGVLRGDMNNDGSVNLKDAIVVLQILSGMSPSQSIYLDLDGDRRVGVGEAIYVLQFTAGLRQQ